MKTLSTAILFGLAIGFVNVASAEPFKQRSHVDIRQQQTSLSHYTTNTRDDMCVLDRKVVVQSMGFKQKSAVELQNIASDYSDRMVADTTTTSRRGEQC